MKKFIFIILASLIVFIGCDSADENDCRQQEEMQKEAQAQTGLPAITHFREKKSFKMLMEMCDQEKLITYIYTFSQFQGKFIFIGKAIGFPIPMSTEYTNPSKVTTNGVIPQADPNGLFKPASADGTWVMLLDKKGEPHPAYFEEKINATIEPLY